MEFQEVAKGLRTTARKLSPRAAVEAFGICMDPPVMGLNLPGVAMHYRESRNARLESCPVREVVENLKWIKRAARDLGDALSESSQSPETMDELWVAARIAKQNAKDAPSLVKAAQEARVSELPGMVPEDLSPWSMRLNGLQALTSWILEELSNDVNPAKPASHWDSGHSESPEESLHRELLQIFRDNNVKDRWLQHVASVVKAWDEGIDLIDVATFWGKAARTKARVFWREIDLAMTQCGKRIIKNAFRGIQFRYTGRTGNRKA